MFERCQRCNRILKNPIYQKLGYGGVCLNKLNKIKKPILFSIKKGS